MALKDSLLSVDQMWTSCGSPGRFICQSLHVKSLFKTHYLGNELQTIFACWYEALSSPVKKVLGTFQFPKLTSVHTCNEISFPFLYLGERNSAGQVSLSLSPNYHLTQTWPKSHKSLNPLERRVSEWRAKFLSKVHVLSFLLIIGRRNRRARPH